MGVDRLIGHAYRRRTVPTGEGTSSVPAVPDRKQFDVGVIGLGGLGSAAAYWLARQGADVVGFEQFELGHVRGTSHDHSRIIRRSYHTPGYVELTAGAYRAWESVERDVDEAVITRTGGVDLFPADAAIDPAPYRSSLDAVGIPHEWIDAAEIRRRWPAFDRGTVVDGEVMGISSPDTGIVPAGRGDRDAPAPGSRVRRRAATALAGAVGSSG